MNGSTPARRQPAPPAILAELRRMDALELQLLRSVLVDALQRVPLGSRSSYLLGSLSSAARAELAARELAPHPLRAA